MAGMRSMTQAQVSLPVRGAWIEITASGGASAAGVASLPVRGAWIEIVLALVKSHKRQSLPVRGAWIEMVQESRRAL